ncbi:MAG: hypothetical protein LBB05_00815 [Puniceicoccales bacterium]|jgi:hypothetical protein|nr:hypothetical protein [Puniceicoccales bacterium]
MKLKHYLLFCYAPLFVGDVIYGVRTPFSETQKTPVVILPESQVFTKAQKQSAPLLRQKTQEIPFVIYPEEQLQLSSLLIKNLLKKEGALNTYAILTAVIKKELQSIKDNMDWINDLMERIYEISQNKPVIRANVDSLKEKQKNLNNIYIICVKELKYEPQGNCSLIVNAIKDLKELQDATQELRNSARDFLDRTRQLLSEYKNTLIIQELRGSKWETKLIDRHGAEMTKKVDRIIDGVLAPASEAFNEYAREERGRGTIGSQSNRAL